MRIKPRSPLPPTRRSGRRKAHSRRMAAVSLAGALSVGLVACGAAPTSDAAGSSSSPVSRAAATPSAATPPPTARIEQAALAPAQFSGPAVDLFGADDVQTAYEEVGAYLNLTTFNESLMARDASAEDFEFATAYMTPSMATDYRATVQRALSADDADASVNLNTMSFYQIDGNDEGITFRSDGPLVTDHTIGNPQVSVSQQGSLKVVVTETAQWHVNVNGAPSIVPVTKTSTFFLVPGQGTGNPPNSWLINGTQASWQAGEVTADGNA